jgi:hypothetical protein
MLMKSTIARAPLARQDYQDKKRQLPRALQVEASDQLRLQHEPEHRNW